MSPQVPTMGGRPWQKSSEQVLPNLSTYWPLRVRERTNGKLLGNMSAAGRRSGQAILSQWSGKCWVVLNGGWMESTKNLLGTNYISPEIQVRNLNRAYELPPIGLTDHLSGRIDPQDYFRTGHAKIITSVGLPCPRRGFGWMYRLAGWWAVLDQE